MLIIVKMPKETSQQSIFLYFCLYLTKNEINMTNEEQEVNNDLKICFLL